MGWKMPLGMVVCWNGLSNALWKLLKEILFQTFGCWVLVQDWPKSQNNWINGVRDSFCHGSMPEWLINCFLKVFEGYHNSWNLWSECFLRTDQKVQKIYKWGGQCLWVWLYAGMAGQMLLGSSWKKFDFRHLDAEYMFRINQKVKIFG